MKKGNKVEVFGTLIRSHITPETIEAEVGDELTIHLTNLERAQDETHGFTLSDLQRACLDRAGQDRHGQGQGSTRKASIRTTARSSAPRCTWRCRATCWSSRRAGSRPRSPRRRPTTPRPTTTSS
ncbi:MAG: hypothetical protein MZW92_42860 [Comamonadaceae bacterium]|nr:hypothetical protein [Comamonadaceae bacterium]